MTEVTIILDKEKVLSFSNLGNNQPIQTSSNKTASPICTIPNLQSRMNMMIVDKVGLNLVVTDLVIDL